MSTRHTSDHHVTLTAGALRVTASFTEEEAVVVASGRLDEVGASALQRMTDRAIAAALDVRLDLSAIEAINAGGLGEILRADRAASAAGRVLLLTSLSDAVEALMTAAHCDDPRGHQH